MKEVSIDPLFLSVLMDLLIMYSLEVPKMCLIHTAEEDYPQIKDHNIKFWWVMIKYKLHPLHRKTSNVISLFQHPLDLNKICYHGFKFKLHHLYSIWPE
jgi:hypothetical protein